MADKKLIHVRIDSDIKDNLNKECREQNRSLSNHVETVLKKHVQKNETNKKFISKKETND